MGKEWLILEGFNLGNIDLIFHNVDRKDRTSKKKCFCSLYLIIFNLIGCPIFFTRLPLHYVMLDRERITGHPVRIAHILLLASTFNKTHS